MRPTTLLLLFLRDQEGFRNSRLRETSDDEHIFESGGSSVFRCFFFAFCALCVCLLFHQYQPGDSSRTGYRGPRASSATRQIGKHDLLIAETTSNERDVLVLAGMHWFHGFIKKNCLRRQRAEHPRCSPSTNPPHRSVPLAEGTKLWGYLFLTLGDST